MRFETAQEIFNSPEKINVLYEGKPVWIHNLDPQKETASITFTGSEGEKIEVPVKKLQKEK